MNAIVRARDLAVDYTMPGGVIRALDGASFELQPGRSLGLVGESGSGKSTLGLAIGRLLPANVRHAGGDLEVDGRSVFALDDAGIRALRRTSLGFVFQSPMAALDPTMRVGRQISLACGGQPEVGRVPQLLHQVGLPQGTARAWPHELSGGMAQRAVIAMAIARRPRLLVADEPTAALDTSLRAQILDLLVALKNGTGAALVLLSHELPVVARVCESIGVMYGGRVVELGDSAAVFSRPLHPYSKALLATAQDGARPGERLAPIPGMPPVLSGPASGCSFAPRCAFADERCRSERPPLRPIGGRLAACHHVDDTIPERDSGMVSIR